MKNEDEVLEIIIPLLRDVINGFIGHPNKLDLEATRVGTILNIRVTHHPDDYPKLIGKKGANISALIALFSEIGAKLGVNIRITVPTRPKPLDAAPAPAFVNDPNWPRMEFTETLSDVLEAICDHPVKIDEHITQARTSRVGDLTIEIDESSLFMITPSYEDLPTFTRKIEISLEVIFRAIGQQQGRRLNLSFVNEQTERSQGRAVAQ